MEAAGNECLSDVPKIKPLSETTVNRIAAGEIIQVSCPSTCIAYEGAKIVSFGIF